MVIASFHSAVCDLALALLHCSNTHPAASFILHGLVGVCILFLPICSDTSICSAYFSIRKGMLDRVDIMFQCAVTYSNNRSKTERSNPPCGMWFYNILLPKGTIELREEYRFLRCGRVPNAAHWDNNRVLHPVMW